MGYKHEETTHYIRKKMPYFNKKYVCRLFPFHEKISVIEKDIDIEIRKIYKWTQFKLRKGTKKQYYSFKNDAETLWTRSNGEIMFTRDIEREQECRRVCKDVSSCEGYSHEETTNY